MMKIAVCVAVLVAVASAQQFQQFQQQQAQAPIPILRLASDIQPDGKWQYEYATGNGIQARAVGDQKPAGRDGPIHSVQGQFAWTSPEGLPVEITYVADENGYQPQGAALPTPPPIPEAILRSLEFNARYGSQE